MTQRSRVREYLEAGNKLTRLSAWDELGILECPARISELRREGMEIITKRKVVTNRYGEKVSIAEWSI
jgi:hypothetical protein